MAHQRVGTVADKAAPAGFVISSVLSAVVVRFGDVPSEVAALLALHGRTLLATTAIAVIAVLMCGLAPAFTATRFEVLPVLKDEGVTSTPRAVPRGCGGASSSHRWRCR